MTHRCAEAAATVLRRHGDPVVERCRRGSSPSSGRGRARGPGPARRPSGDRAAAAARRDRARDRRAARRPRRRGRGDRARHGRDGLPSGEVVAAATQVARAAEAGELRLSAPVRALLGASRSGHADATPLAGRDRELEQLHGRSAGAAGGTASLTLLLGEPGIGKSRLVRELAVARGRSRASSSVTASRTATGSRTGRCARWCSRRCAGGRWRP